MDAELLERQVAALDDGGGFLDGSHLLAVEVSGADAAGWLNDLVTTGIADLAVGRSARSLLLSPTGRIRADFHVWRARSAFVLVQDEDQPAPVDELLRPYVLSSDVHLGRLGRDATFVLVPAGARGWELADAPAPDAAGVEPDAAEAWRIRRGVPRFPIDLDEDSLPAEAGLDTLIDLRKGCFLGQEAVAKVRNLGHPARVILARRADGAVKRGDRVLTDEDDAGAVTSATSVGTGTALLSRVRWDARDLPLHTSSGRELLPA